MTSGAVLSAAVRITNAPVAARPADVVVGFGVVVCTGGTVLGER